MIQTIATTITAIGVLFALVALRQARRQRVRQFEAFYVARYWHLMDELSLPAIRGGPGPRTEADEKVVWSYLILAEDQIDLRRKGWISSGAWSIWEEGIRSQLAVWPFKQVWDFVKTEQSTYTTSHAFTGLHDLMAADAEWDPYLTSQRRSQRLKHRVLDGGEGA